MNRKLFSTILIACAFFHTSLLCANHFNKEDWQFTTSATGNTTGHIGDLVITNKTNKVNTIRLGSFIIPPENDVQGYAIFKEEIEQIEIKPGDTQESNR